jgi:cytoskeletal protein CcmA (bactofilin family)
MMWGMALLAMTAGWFSLPLIPCFLEWRNKRDAAPIPVIRDYEGHVRYFADRFRQLVEERLRAGMTAGELPPRDFLVIEDNGVVAMTREERRACRIGRVILSLRSVKLPDNFQYLQEIYCAQDLLCGGNSRFRAILANGRLVLGEGSSVLRWVHGRTVQVSSDCRIFGRLSADDEIRIGPNCGFGMVQAPLIWTGPADPPKPLLEPKDVRRIEGRKPKAAASFGRGGGRRIVDGNLEFPADTRWTGDLIVKGNLVVRERAEITGSIKAYGKVVVESGARISGSLISKKDLAIGLATEIGGPVVAEREITFWGESRIGQEAEPTSITAPVINLGENVLVHGTIRATQNGTTLARGGLESGERKPRRPDGNLKLLHGNSVISLPE